MTNLSVSNEKAKMFWAFVEKEKRLPSGKEKEEKNLYEWCKQVIYDKRGLAGRFPDIVGKIKELGFKGKKEMTLERVGMFWEFIEKNGRLPKRSVKEEKNLYEFCARVRFNIRGVADRFPEVLEKLKEMRFGNSYDVRSEEKLKEFFDFVEKNGRLPKHGVKEERKLYEFCINVSINKYHSKDKFPQVWNTMQQMRWKKISVKNPERAKEFCDYVEKHGRLPHYGEDKYSQMKSFYYSLKKNRGNARERYPEAWHLVKDKDVYPSLVRKNMIEEFWQFVERHGRLPRRREHKSLYSWCLKMEHNKKDIRQNYPKEWEKMQEIGIPDRKSAACSEEKVREFWEFVEKNGRLPKWNVNEEKNLYYWCARVIKKQTYPDVVKKLKDMEWGNKTLNESMQNLVDFVKENKRLPRWDIKEEKNLYKK